MTIVSIRASHNRGMHFTTDMAGRRLTGGTPSIESSHALLLDGYTVLTAIEPILRDDVLQHHMQWLTAPVLFDEGSPCRGFPMVIAGEVSVARGSAQGRELALYRVQRGELCVISTSCTAGARPMHAHGVTTQPSHIALLDAAGRRRRSTRVEPAQRAGDRGHRRTPGGYRHCL